MAYIVTEYTERVGEGLTASRTVAICPEYQDAEIIAAEYREAAGAGAINLQTTGIHWRYVVEDQDEAGVLVGD